MNNSRPHSDRETLMNREEGGWKVLLDPWQYFHVAFVALSERKSVLSCYRVSHKSEDTFSAGGAERGGHAGHPVECTFFASHLAGANLCLPSTKTVSLSQLRPRGLKEKVPDGLLI